MYQTIKCGYSSLHSIHHKIHSIHCLHHNLPSCGAHFEPTRWCVFPSSLLTSSIVLSLVLFTTSCAVGDYWLQVAAHAAIQPVPLTLDSTIQGFHSTG